MSTRPTNVPDGPIPFDLKLAITTALACAAAGVFALGFSFQHYEELPARVPVHFGFSGHPDRWTAKTAGSVFFLPGMALGMGLGLSAMPFLVLKMRKVSSGSTLPPQAEAALRSSIARFLCLVAVLATAFLVTGSVSSLYVGLGRFARLPPIFFAEFAALVLVVVAGSVRLVLESRRLRRAFQPRT